MEGLQFEASRGKVSWTLSQLISWAVVTYEESTNRDLDKNEGPYLKKITETKKG
jgi:hypothetical protein